MTQGKDGKSHNKGTTQENSHVSAEMMTLASAEIDAELEDDICRLGKKETGKPLPADCLPQGKVITTGVARMSLVRTKSGRWTEEILAHRG